MSMITWKEITKEQLREHFDNGLWYEEIGEIYGITGRSVRTKVSKFELTLCRKNQKVIKEEIKKICVKCGKEYKTSKNEGYCSSNCFISSKCIDNLDKTKQSPTTLLALNIQELREKGLTYLQIATHLGCSKSTVGYWCNNTSKEKILYNTNKKRENKNFTFLFSKRISDFKTTDRFKYKSNIKQINASNRKSSWFKIYSNRIMRFRKRNENKVEKEYNYEKALEHLGGINTKCYLTGDPINIETDDYCLDHIIPASKGGNNELENMGITTPSANASKTDLNLDEYLELCKKVLINFGYSVNKI